MIAPNCRLFSIARFLRFFFLAKRSQFLARIYFRVNSNNANLKQKKMRCGYTLHSTQNLGYKVLTNLNNSPFGMTKSRHNIDAINFGSIVYTYIGEKNYY